MPAYEGKPRCYLLTLAPSLRVDEVEVLLQVETRGPEHCEHVKETLRGAGYHLVFS
jgi:threonine dehydratase